MALPSYLHVEEALLCLIFLKGGSNFQMMSFETYEPLADYFNLSEQERTRGRLFKDGRYEPQWNNMVQWSRRQLKKKGYLDESAPRATWKLTIRGIVAAKGISNKYLALQQTQDPDSKHEQEVPRESIIEDTKTLPDVEEINISVKEGGRRLITHFRRERNPHIVAEKKAQVLKVSGKLKCEVCTFDFSEKYGDLGYGFCEAHHKKPLSDANREIETKLEDLAILCSNCHRMIHRTKPMMSINEFKKLLLKVEG